MTGIDLKPCPFCGSTAKMQHKGKLYEIWVNHADRCPMKIPKITPRGFDRDILRENWNMRAAEKYIKYEAERE